MKRPTFSFLKTALSSLKTAPGNVKTYLHDNAYGYCSINRLHLGHPGKLVVLGLHCLRACSAHG